MTPTLTLNPTNTSTIVPTLPAEGAWTKLLELLANNGGCRLPCLWGITPGKSTYKEAQAILTPLRSISDPLTTRFGPDGGAIFPVYIEEDLELNVAVGFNIDSNSDNQVISRIGFRAREEKKTIASNGEPTFAEIFDSASFGERVQPYMLSQVLSEQGIPAAVLIQTFNALASMGNSIGGGFDILLLYPEQGLLVHYTTQMEVIGEKVRGCLTNAHVDLELYPAGHGDSFAQFLSQTRWAEIWPLPAKPYWAPVEKATSMSLEQFYETFRQSMDQCIETPTKFWPAPFQ